MPRALVVETDTTELRIALQRGCRLAMAETVTLTVTRMGSTCNDVLQPLDSSCNHIPQIVVDSQPIKVYHAVRIEPGLAVFALDYDLTEALEGWYLGRLAMDGCDVAVLTIWVRCSAVAALSLGPLSC